MGEGRVALVTGGSRGIGAAICEHLARCGHRVAFTYRTEKDAAEAVARRIRSAGGSAACFACEGTSSESVRAALAAIRADVGDVEVLVNNIGKIHDAIAASMEGEFEDVVRTNLRSTFLFTRGVVGPMMRRRWGRIVNITSMVGRNPGGVGQSNYIASKAAIHAFTRSTALELAARGITVNAVAPGLIRTDLSRAVLQSRPGVERALPARRLGEKQEVADLVEFLVGDKAAYITGEVVGVTGGACL